MMLPELPSRIDLDQYEDPAAYLVALVEPATRWLAQASDILLVDELRAQAAALETYARARRLADAAVGSAQVIARRTEIALGRLMPELPRGRGNLAGPQPFDAPERSRLRLLADHAEEVEQAIAVLAATGEASRSAVIARIRRADRQQVDRDARTVHVAPDHRVVDGDGWRMIGGDFRDVLAEVEPDTIDMIVTDPPYPQESLPLWSDLGLLAARVLVPGGVLAALTGQYWLPDVMARLGEHLAYGWTYCQPLPGASARVLSRHVGQTWKPWLCFTNGPWPSGRVDWHPDTLAPDPRAKGRYTWEQQAGPARQLVERLSPHGGLVLDPMCGVATYGVAALAAGRRFVGTEADAARFDQSVERLHAAETNPDTAA